MKSRVVTFLKIFLTCCTLCGSQSFAQLATGHSKFLGSAYGSTSQSVLNFNSYWNQVTPENAGKWGSVAGTGSTSDSSTWSWSGLSTAYDYAKSRGFKFKQHTFVWGSQYPSWLTGLTQANQKIAVEKWIKAYAWRYPNTDFIDVVNEPVKTACSFKAALGGDNALYGTGWDWVVWSFEKARQYCPNAKLLLNEYGTENDATARSQFIAIVNILKARNLIDGIGLQGHCFNLDYMSASDMTTCLNAYAATGVDVYISELDIRGISGSFSDANQLQKYQDLFPVIWNHSSLKGVTLWGYVQGSLWKPEAWLLTTGSSERSALQWLRTYLEEALPVEMVSFSVQPTGSEMVLQWATATEVNNYGFEVQRRSGIGDFATIGFVEGNGNSAATNRYYFSDKNFTKGTRNTYRLKQIDFAGSFKYSTEIDVAEVPVEFSLSQNYPNPFNPSTAIRYSLNTSSKVELAVYNVLGAKIRTLESSVKNAGEHSVVWDGTNDNRTRVASGMYLYRLETENKSLQRKMLFVQ